MPLRHRDAFADPTAGRADHGVNPFFTRLVEHRSNPSLPLLFGADLRDAAGKWRQRIGQHVSAQSKPTPLVLEIGCYKGETLVGMAQAEPDAAFIGIDITYKRVVMTADRLQQVGANNAVCALAHMNPSTFRQLFADGELDLVCIFFPDPWVKQRQEHNRLLQPDLAKEIWRCLQPTGQVWFKTDQNAYFQQASAAFAEAGFQLEHKGLKLLRDFHRPTPFERRFAAQGLVACEGVWAKISTEQAN